MNRREFTALIGAGALFPMDLAKALGSEGSEGSEFVRATHWYRLGTDEDPIRDVDAEEIEQCLLGWKTGHKWTQRLKEIRRLGYLIKSPPGQWVIKLGNENRPAFPEDFKDFHNYLSAQIKQPNLTITGARLIVTAHTSVLYEIQESLGLTSPIILSHEKVDRLEHKGVVRRVSPKWENAFLPSSRPVCG